MVVRNWGLVGGDPAPGEPRAYEELSGILGRTATNAENAHKRLSDLKESVDDSIWKGEAADAFKEQVGKLPGDLEKLFESYRAAADAMGEYGRTLTTLKEKADGLVSAAETAEGDESTQRQALNDALAVEPTTPTVPYDEAMEGARRRIREAKNGIDAIRTERQGAETKAVNGLGHAGDIGIHNKKWYQKALAALADAAEFVAFALAVIAIVVVVVVLLTNPAGWAALSAALAAAAPLFTASTIASGVALTAKIIGKALGDRDITMSELASDAAWLGLSAFAGAKLGKVAATSMRATTVGFTRAVTEVRPVLGAITSTGKVLVLETRTTVSIVRVTRIQPIRIPLHLDGVWNIGAAWHKDIPDYLGKHPEMERQLEGRPVPKPAMGVILGRDISCSAFHAPIPQTVGTR